MSNRLLLSTVLLIICLSFSVFGEQKRYNGYSVLRITPQTPQQVDYLKHLSETNFELDFWTFPSMVNHTVDVMVPPHLKNSLGTVFLQKHYSFQTMISDLENLLEEQRKEELTRADPDFWTKYQTLDVVNSYINTIVTENPSIATSRSIGKSSQGRDIILLQLSTGGNNKPIIFIDSNIHAREWITCATTTYFIQQLIDGYTGGNQEIQSLMTTFDFYIIPILNPDGYVYSFTNERMWRKTRSSNAGSTCIGTDPNRNFDHNWGGQGSSTNPCSETFRGSAAFSEPEPKAVADLLLSIKGRVKLYIAMHSYSQLLLGPWGDKTGYPPNYADQQTKSKAFTDAIAADYGTSYVSGTTANVLYIASGNGADWAYDEAGIQHSYTVELRDKGTYGFALPANQIEPSGKETTKALIAMAKLIEADQKL